VAQSCANVQRSSMTILRASASACGTSARPMSCAAYRDGLHDTQAHRHTGTQAQRHRGTEAQRHRGTKAQRHRGTEAQRHRGTEAQRHRGTEAHNQARHIGTDSGRQHSSCRRTTEHATGG
jgi:hypothetical protein